MLSKSMFEIDSILSKSKKNITFNNTYKFISVNVLSSTSYIEMKSIVQITEFTHGLLMSTTGLTIFLSSCQRRNEISLFLERIKSASLSKVHLIGIFLLVILHTMSIISYWLAFFRWITTCIDETSANHYVRYAVYFSITWNLTLFSHPSVINAITNLLIISDLNKINEKLVCLNQNMFFRKNLDCELKKLRKLHFLIERKFEEKEILINVSLLAATSFKFYISINLIFNTIALIDRLHKRIFTFGLVTAFVDGLIIFVHCYISDLVKEKVGINQYLSFCFEILNDIHEYLYVYIYL